MLNNHHLSLRVFTALMLLSCPALRGEPAPKNPIEVSALSMPDIVSDLEKRGKAISAELAESPIDNREKPERTIDHKRVEKVKASSEISQCLALRGSFVKHPVIPTDPLYRALQKRTLADLDLQAALVWWQYCKDESQYRSLKSFDEWPLAAQLKSGKVTADAEFASLRPKPEIDKSAGERTGSGIGLGSPMSNRLVQSNQRTGSVLDRLAGWDKMSDEEKSKIIAR